MSGPREQPRHVRDIIGPGWDGIDVEIRFVNLGSPDHQCLTVTSRWSGKRKYQRLRAEQQKTHTGHEAVRRVVEGER